MTGLRAGGFGVTILIRTRGLSNSGTSRPTLEATQPSIQMVHGFFPGGRAGEKVLSEREFNHSFPCSAEVKKDFFPLVCLHGVC